MYKQIIRAMADEGKWKEEEIWRVLAYADFIPKKTHCNMHVFMEVQTRPLGVLIPKVPCKVFKSQPPFVSWLQRSCD